MVGRKLPKALSKNPKPFVDVSSGLMNVPDSVSRLPTSGVDFTVGGTTRSPSRRNGKNGQSGFKAGKKEGLKLSKGAGKRASRILRS